MKELYDKIGEWRENCWMKISLKNIKWTWIYSLFVLHNATLVYLSNARDIHPARTTVVPFLEWASINYLHDDIQLVLKLRMKYTPLITEKEMKAPTIEFTASSSLRFNSEPWNWSFVLSLKQTFLAPRSQTSLSLITSASNRLTISTSLRMWSMRLVKPYLQITIQSFMALNLLLRAIFHSL